MQEAQLQPQQQHCSAWDLKDTAFWRLASLLVPHHVTEGSEASCIVQMRINTEELHAEQDKRR